MAGHFPNDAQYIDEEEEEEVMYDQIQQFLEDQAIVIEDQDIVVEDEDEEEDGEDDEREEDDPHDEDYVYTPRAEVLPRVSPAPVIGWSSENVVDENEDGQRRMGGGETSSSQCNRVEDGENSSGGEWNRSEIDGLFCPICMEAWTNGGEHQICCLPCGHLYGLSCINKWFKQCRNSRKCPQCSRKCYLKDVRVLYASQIVVVDQELQKKVRSLEAVCVSLQKKDAQWCKKEVEWQRKEADLRLKMNQLTERSSYLERLLEDSQSRPLGSFTASGVCQEQVIFGHNDQEFGRQGSSSNFILQKELQVDGARFFDVDASGQIFVIARRLSGIGGMHVLTKMSLIAPYERENIQLPVNTKAVKDLRVSPHGRLALLASLGKKLSVISTESNNVVLTYDLPAAAWSCSWDLNSSHYMYAGLQNGMLMVFDMRQTMGPVESMVGLTCNPIHTVISLSPDLTLCPGVRTILTASSVGLCHWNVGGVEERPFLVPESKNQGVCISLAYCPSSNDIVASFRPKVELSSDMAVSQVSLTPSNSLMGQAVRGSHVLYKRVGSKGYQILGSTCANVNDIRLPKSAIIDTQNHNPLFAYGDEVTGELVLQDLPSLMVVEHLKSQKHPIRDVKYTHALSTGLLSCLSEDSIQLFSSKFVERFDIGFKDDGFLYSKSRGNIDDLWDVQTYV